MQLLLLDKTSDKKWDEFIMSSTKGAFGHLAGWKNVYDLYGYRSFHIALIDETERIRGVLPLFLMKDIFGKKFLISNSFLSHGGVCANGKEARNSLIQKAKEIAVEEGVEYIEIRQFGGTEEELPVKKDFVAMLLKLDGNDEYIWKNKLKPKTRNQVRKAQKSGLTVHFGKEYFDDYYRVLSVNHRDFGTPLHEKNFFIKVLESFQDKAGIIVVKHQEKVIAGMLYIHCRNVFSDPWASSLREYNRLCPNNILYWEAIKFAIKNGFEYFDFGRSTIDCGTYNFKKQWGAKPVQLNYSYFLNRANKIPVVNAHDNRYQLAIDIWKKLPLPIANFIGHRVIRYLPEL